jgi:VWFA-related protein
MKLRTLLLSLLVLALAQTPAPAQLRILIDSIKTTNFPEVLLHLRVLDGENAVRNLRLADFTIFENGTVVPIDGGYCQDTIARGPVSVLLVIDVSRSMGGFPWGTNAIVDARRAAKSFVDRLAPDDESALLSFSDNTYYNQPWTNDWALLKSRIDQLNVVGGTALWDAVVTGSNLIRNRAKKKVMIVLTDGQDTNSSATSSAAISAAISAGAIVYTIGLGADLDESNMRTLAQQTGGKYFNAPNASDLDQIYGEINLALISTGICELRYRSPIDCWNGDEITVDVRAATPSGTATGTVRYTLPHDSSTFSYVTLAMERDYVIDGGKRITIPLELERVSIDRAPTTFDFTVGFDTQLLTLVNAEVTTLSTGFSPQITPTTQGARILLTGSTAITTTGTLLNLTFEAIRTDFSAKSEISISPPEVQRFCTVARASSGLLTVSGSCERALGAPPAGTIRARFLGASPNPFNPSTLIRFTLDGEAEVTLEARDLLGRRVATLVDGVLDEGQHTARFDASTLDDGAYILALSTRYHTEYLRVVLLK